MILRFTIKFFEGIDCTSNFCDRFITYGRETILTGDPVEQEKRIKYTTLITNAIMLHNVADLTGTPSQNSSFNSNKKIIQSQRKCKNNSYIKSPASLQGFLFFIFI